MALCCNCGNFDDQEIENDFGCFHLGRRPKRRKGYHPDLYYYWDAPLEELYYWRDSFPNVDCMCEICFDIANYDNKIIWADHQCANNISGTSCIELMCHYVIIIM